jgi:hypothetical protein
VYQCFFVCILTLVVVFSGRQQFKNMQDRCKDVYNDSKRKKDKQSETDLLDEETGGFIRRVHRLHKAQRRVSDTYPVSAESPQQTEADILLARAIIVCGVAPFILENKHLQEALTAVAIVGPRYVPPTRKQV